MKKLQIIMLSLLIITIFTTGVRAGEIVIEENPMVGFLRFLYCISETDRASETMKKIYTSHRVNNKEDEIYIKKLRDTMLSLPQYVYQGRNFTEHSPKYKTSSLFYYYAASSKNIREFKFLLSSLIPDKKLKDIFEVIDYFLPVYEELYYKEGEKDLKEMVKSLNEDKDEYTKLLEKVSSLYSPSLPDTDIKIILVPLYISRKEIEDYKNMTIESQSLGNLQILETVLPAKDKIDIKAIGIHEIIHYYQELSQQNSIFTEEMRNYDPLFGRISSGYINEAMATVIQVYSSYLSGKKVNFKDSWYEDKIIDGYGKELYPVITEYIKEGKIIDKELAVKSVDIFKNKFPKAPEMKEIVFQELNLMTGSFNIMDVMPVVLRITRSSAIYGNDPLTGKDIPKSYEKNCSQIFILRPDEINKLTPFNLPDKEKIRKTIEKNKNFAFSVFDKKRGLFNIIFICEDCDQLSKILKKLWNEDFITEGG